MAQEVADLGAGLGGAHVVEPGGVGAGVGGGDDLDPVAVGELGAQRHEFAVDAAGDAAVADVGVDGVGEVDGGGAARQGEDLAAWGEDEDFVRVEVDLEAFQKVARFGVV